MWVMRRVYSLGELLGEHSGGSSTSHCEVITVELLTFAETIESRIISSVHFHLTYKYIQFYCTSIESLTSTVLMFAKLTYYSQYQL